MRQSVPNFQTFRTYLVQFSYVFGFSSLFLAFSSLSKCILNASSPLRTFESRRHFNFASSAFRSQIAYSVGAVWGTPRIRLDLLMAAVVVPIALTGIIRCSGVILIKFAIYLRSMSSPFRSRALQCFLYFHSSQHTPINQHTETPQCALNTRFTYKNQPGSKHLFFHHLLNNQSRRTVVRSESGDRLR